METQEFKSRTQTPAAPAPAGSNLLELVDELLELAPKDLVDFQVLKRYAAEDIAKRFVSMREKLLTLRAAIERRDEV